MEGNRGLTCLLGQMDLFGNVGQDTFGRQLMRVQNLGVNVMFTSNVARTGLRFNCYPCICMMLLWLRIMVK